MNHPLSGDIASLSDADLAKKIQELQKRSITAYNMGAHVMNQLEMLLEDYREEQRRRDATKMDNLNQSDKGKDWDDLIDI